MLFCPTCANFLLITSGNTESSSFYCNTCNYVFKVTETMRRPLQYTKKASETFIWTSEQEGEGDQIEITCPNCSNNKALFKMLQIRSADEGSTLFYKCLKCKFTWFEN